MSNDRKEKMVVDEKLVDSVLRYHFTEIAFSSREMFEHASSYKKRGCLICGVKGMASAMSKDDHPFFFVNIDIMRKDRIGRFNGKVMEYVEKYDPESECVVYVGITMDDIFVKAGMKPVYEACSIVHKDDYAKIEPLHDKVSGEELKSSFLNGNFELNPQIIEGNRVYRECTLCAGVAEKEVVCGRCKETVYCSNKCMREAKKVHMKSCVYKEKVVQI